MNRYDIIGKPGTTRAIVTREELEGPLAKLIQHHHETFDDIGLVDATIAYRDDTELDILRSLDLA